jgi:hypothetical protein
MKLIRLGRMRREKVQQEAIWDIFRGKVGIKAFI